MTKILVCFHKNYEYKYTSIYSPILGGADLKPNIYEGVLLDNNGENISKKNPYYSELTALYWGWKNLDYEYLGLVHYRRYLKGKDKITVDNKTIKVISEEEIKRYLSKYDVILPKKRKYYIETLYNHYIRTLRKEPIIALEKVLTNSYPTYIREFNRLKKRRSAHMFNMMIGNKEFVNNYCSFLFGVLNKIEDEINSESWSTYEKRYMGSISELLMDVFINTHNIKYKEVKFVELIRFAFIRKAFNYLMIKFFGKKYKGRMK